MEVIIYTSEKCERCKFVKKMLDEHGMNYTEITDRNIIAEKDLYQVPAIEVDGKIIESYNMVIGWLKQNGCMKGYMA